MLRAVFVISTTTTKGHTLDVSMMSFARYSVGLDSVALPLTIVMTPATTLLKEVAVKADRIREQGDTITYNVGTFAQAQDRSIGDVLKRMPGIDVNKSGKIQYQGEDINKFTSKDPICWVENTEWPPTASTTTTWEPLK